VAPPYLILVTDNPDDGRSCFQAIDVADDQARTPQDVDKVEALDIYPPRFASTSIS